jgi:predicted nucleic acid-binding protein
VLSVLRRRRLAGDLSRHRFDQAVGDLIDLPIERVRMRRLIPRAAELATNGTAYDAVYVALAEGVGATLVTGDTRLATAPGIEAAITLVVPPSE